MSRHLACAALTTALLSLTWSTATLAADAIPAMQSEGAVQYACGGIGSDESKAMRAAMKDHPLSLLFSRKGGEYLANVEVEISGAGQAKFVAQGPVCLIQLPQGQYTVKARAPKGESQTKEVAVGGQGKTLDFRY